MKIYFKNDKLKEELSGLGNNPTITKIRLISFSSPENIKEDMTWEELEAEEIQDPKYYSSVYCTSESGKILVQFKLEDKEILKKIREFHAVKLCWNGEESILLVNFRANGKLAPFPLTAGENLVDIKFSDINSSLREFRVAQNEETWTLDNSCIFPGELGTISPDIYHYNRLIKGVGEKPLDPSGRIPLDEVTVREYQSLELTCKEAKDGIVYGLSKTGGRVYFSGTAVYNEYRTRYGEEIPGSRKEGVSVALESENSVKLYLRAGLGNLTVNKDFSISHEGEFNRLVYASVTNPDGTGIRSNEIRLTTDYIEKDDIFSIDVEDYKYFEATKRDKPCGITQGTRVVIIEKQEGVNEYQVVLRYRDEELNVSDLQVSYDTSKFLSAFSEMSHKVSPEDGTITFTFVLNPKIAEGGNLWYPLNINTPWLYPIKITVGKESYTFCPVVKVFPSKIEFADALSNENRLKITLPENETRKIIGVQKSDHPIVVQDSDKIPVSIIESGKTYTVVTEEKSEFSLYLSDEYLDGTELDWRNDITRSLITPSGSSNFGPIYPVQKTRITNTLGRRVRGGVGIYKFRILSSGKQGGIEIDLESSDNVSGYFHDHYNHHAPGIMVNSFRNKITIREDYFYKNSLGKTGFTVYVIIDDVKGEGTFTVSCCNEKYTMTLIPTKHLEFINEPVDKYCFVPGTIFVSSDYSVKNKNEDGDVFTRLNVIDGDSLTPTISPVGNYRVDINSGEGTIELQEDIENNPGSLSISLVSPSDFGLQLIEENSIEDKGEKLIPTINKLYIPSDKDREIVYKYYYSNDSWMDGGENRSIGCRISSTNKEIEVKSLTDGSFSVKNLTGNPNIDSNLSIEITCSEGEQKINTKRLKPRLVTVLPQIYGLRYKLQVDQEYQPIGGTIRGLALEKIGKLPIYLAIYERDYSYSDTKIIIEENETPILNSKDIKRLCKFTATDWIIETENGEFRNISEYLDDLKFEYESPNNRASYCLRYAIKENKLNETFTIVGDVSMELSRPANGYYCLPITKAFRLRAVHEQTAPNQI